MSRKRDTNWSRDEITVLLDSIMEITRTRAEDGKRTNSREVFEYAAKKMGEKGHTSRAEREKCRTKWKKMKEEYTHAKRARDGDSRYKEAPGIHPFYERMEEFINGNFDNISPHSTIVRRTSSLSSSRPSPGMRASARIAANTNGTTSTDEKDTSSSTIVTRINTSSEYSNSVVQTSSDNTSPSARQNSRLSSSSNNSMTVLPPSSDPTTTTTTLSTSHQQQQPQQQQQQQQQPVSNGELCTIYTTYSNTSNTASNLLSGNNHEQPLSINQSTEHADISYRVSTGCRQITIFGDHDVDIKFRGDCVTINKINVDYSSTEST